MTSQRFEYKPLNDDQLQALRPVIEDGVYPFQVQRAIIKTSSTGNPMVELNLKIWDNEGKERYLFDYLVGTDNMIWKTKRFWQSVGEPERYNGQNDASDFLLKEGYLKTQKKPTDRGLQAKVVAYILPDELENAKLSVAPKPTAAVQDKDFPNDDVPF